MAIASNLDKAIKLNRNKKLKAFVVYANVNHEADQPLRSEVEHLAERNKLDDVALVVLPAWDKVSFERNEINPCQISETQSSFTRS